MAKLRWANSATDAHGGEDLRKAPRQGGIQKVAFVGVAAGRAGWND